MPAETSINTNGFVVQSGIVQMIVIMNIQRMRDETNRTNN